MSIIELIRWDRKGRKPADLLSVEADTISEIIERFFRAADGSNFPGCQITLIALEGRPRSWKHEIAMTQAEIRSLMTQASRRGSPTTEAGITEPEPTEAPDEAPAAPDEALEAPDEAPDGAAA